MSTPWWDRKVRDTRFFLKAGLSFKEQPYTGGEGQGFKLVHEASGQSVTVITRDATGHRLKDPWLIVYNSKTASPAFYFTSEVQLKICQHLDPLWSGEWNMREIKRRITASTVST